MNGDDVLRVARNAGVTVEELRCWTREDWQRHLQHLDWQQTAMQAAADRDLTACAEAQLCGCPISAAVHDDGVPVIGTARVAHCCGRSS